MIRNEENLEDSALPFLIHPQAEARGQVQFCKKIYSKIYSKKEIVHAQKISRCKNKKTTS